MLTSRRVRVHAMADVWALTTINVGLADPVSAQVTTPSSSSGIAASVGVIRKQRKATVFAAKASLLVVVLLTGILAIPASATVVPNGCIGPDATVTCPAGSPSIAAADAVQGFGVTAAGSVYSELSGPQPGVSNLHLAAPIVGISGSLDQIGYWLVGADGGVFAFGIDHDYLGSMAGHRLNAPVVGIVANPAASLVTNPYTVPEGYWLFAADGGVFAFGNTPFYGSMAGRPLNAPIVAMAPTPDGGGYWLVGADGGVFAFGDAQFYGSRAGEVLSAPIVAISTWASFGYALAGADGAIFTFGGAPFEGAFVGLSKSPIVAFGYAPGIYQGVGPAPPPQYLVAMASGQVYRTQNP
jgi:hypothetical protein